MSESGSRLRKALGHAVRQNALRVADGGDDAGNYIVEKIERRLRRECAVVGFRPEARAGAVIDKLRRQYGR